jgi:sensor histidine kinase YesM
LDPAKAAKKLTKVPIMENSSTFWNEIAEWLRDLGLPYISELEAMLFVLAVFFVLFLILWLVFRKARLWYWKTDMQIDTLKSIDVRLNNVENKLSEAVLRAAETETEAPARDEQEQSGEEAQERAESEPEGITAVGKSGKVYTEAELELQIRE